MKYGLYTPNFGDCGEAATLVELAVECEASGWDGFFIWDHLQWPGMEPAVDPWVALAAIAVRTKRISIGPLVTPLPRRDIVKLARETVSLDRLSQGRLILGIGLGWEALPEWAGFGHEEDAKARGAMLDEGLEVLEALWSGKAVNHTGRYYKAVCEGFAPPIQTPRIPIWIGGTWPSSKPILRAAKWDGVVPISKTQAEDGIVTPSDLVDIRSLIRAAGNERDDYDVAIIGMTPDLNDTSAISEYQNAGATWWVEASAPWTKTVDDMKEQIRKGPPKI